MARLNKKDLVFALVVSGLITLCISLLMQKFTNLTTQIAEQQNKIYEQKLLVIEKQAKIEKL